MRPLRRLAIGLWVVVFLVLGVLVGAGWRPGLANWPLQRAVNTTDDSGDNSADKSQPTESTAVISPIKLGDPLPEIRLSTLAGDSQSIAHWAGRTRVINFWATWCAPCRKEMPLLQQFQQAVDPTRLQVIGIAVDRLDPVMRFLGETGVTYPNLIGRADATRIAERFVADLALPLTVVAAPDGTVLAIHTGELHAEDLKPIAAAADALATGQLTSRQVVGTLLTRRGSRG
ncbi:MAG: TlpA family protein disulfide reductase [Gammaproteobacteria bacterium PRO9]|nr:TlpA family protein disulfide reductase [Gammaproteobacteria bacterium PRO9]